MSKRNLVLLIIILFILIVGAIISLYFYQDKNTTGKDSTPGTNFISQFNPFGSGGTITPPKTIPPTDVSGYQPPTVPEINTKLKKISSMPIAGFTVYNKERLIDVPVVIPPPAPAPEDTLSTPDTTTTKIKTSKPTPPLTEFAPSLRYVDRATGNIYETFADKISERRFSTTIIPKIYEAYFGNKGETVIMRYLKLDGKTIITFVGNLPKEYLGADTTGENEVKGTFLPEGIQDMSLTTDGTSVFYLFKNEDNMIGVILNLVTNKKVQIFNSLFSEWLSVFPNNKMITLTTKPASGFPGYMYQIDPNSKNLMFQVLGNINGLTTLASPNGKLILYGDDNLSLNIYHPNTKTATPVGVRTLPEKCVWGNVGDTLYCAVPKFIEASAYPDSWYQGETSFSDQIWKIDVVAGNATMITDPATLSPREDLDGIKLMLDTDENYLFFVNKKDSFLWELSLK